MSMHDHACAWTGVVNTATVASHPRSWRPRAVHPSASPTTPCWVSSAALSDGRLPDRMAGQAAVALSTSCRQEEAARPMICVRAQRGLMVAAGGWTQLARGCR